jgi:hypothetical protein
MGGAARRHAIDLSPDFDLVHNQLDWLPSPSPDSGGADGHDDPRILGGRHPARLSARWVGLRVDLGFRPLPLLDYAATVHHGIDMTEFASSAAAGDDLVVFGRIHPDKGSRMPSRSRAGRTGAS